MPFSLFETAILAAFMIVAGIVLRAIVRSRRNVRSVGMAASPATDFAPGKIGSGETPSAATVDFPPPKDLGQLTLEERSAIPWLQDQFRSELQQSSGIDIASDRLAQQRMLEAIVQALIRLRTVESTSIELPFIAADASGPKHFKRELDRIEAEAAQA